MNTDAPTATEQAGNTNEGHNIIVQYRLLGSLEVERDGEVVDVGGYKQRALMALLLINANKVVSTDRIIDELWEDGDVDLPASWLDQPTAAPSAVAGPNADLPRNLVREEANAQWAASRTNQGPNADLPRDLAMEVTNG